MNQWSPNRGFIVEVEFQCATSIILYLKIVEVYILTFHTAEHRYYIVILNLNLKIDYILFETKF